MYQGLLNLKRNVYIYTPPIHNTMCIAFLLVKLEIWFVYLWYLWYLWYFVYYMQFLTENWKICDLVKVGESDYLEMTVSANCIDQTLKMLNISFCIVTFWTV